MGIEPEAGKNVAHLALLESVVGDFLSDSLHCPSFGETPLTTVSKSEHTLFSTQVMNTGSTDGKIVLAKQIKATFLGPSLRPTVVNNSQNELLLDKCVRV